MLQDSMGSVTGCFVLKDSATASSITSQIKLQSNAENGKQQRYFRIVLKS